MAVILEVGNWTGPVLTGILAVYPISSTSLILILQPRVGGRAAGAVIANGLWSLFGISFGLIALVVLIVPFGATISLAAALAIPVAWNLTVWIVHRQFEFA
jgi:presenilin-like A22 family membrane protease